MEDLKKKAKARGLWNLFLSKQHYPEHGTDLTNLEVRSRLIRFNSTLTLISPRQYAVFCEIMGHAPLVAPQATNCAAPDTGNMEVFARYGNAEQQAKYLTPLLNGEIRSSFAMTEFGGEST